MQLPLHTLMPAHLHLLCCLQQEVLKDLEAWRVAALVPQAEAACNSARAHGEELVIKWCDRPLGCDCLLVDVDQGVHKAMLGVIGHGALPLR